MSARDELAKIVRDEVNSPVRILGAAISFLRVQSRTPFERQLAEKLDKLVIAEIEAAQRSMTSGHETAAFNPEKTTGE